MDQHPYNKGSSDQKVLILIPGKNARGGITNYYDSIRKHFPSNIIYFYRGSRNWPNRSSKIAEFYRIINDYLLFLYNILGNKISLVQTTTSFLPESLIRDGIFIIISKLFQKKVIVFFRGWNNDFAHNLSGFRLKIFKLLFFKADAIVDLSIANIEYLVELGYKKELFLETTLVDVNLVNGINIDQLIDQRISQKEKTILFLSRLERAKGIYKILYAFDEIKKNHPGLKLIFAGDGSEDKNLRNEIARLKIRDVDLMGFVSGNQKRQLFERASLFILLSDSEGMSSAVLEAMSFGLPVITTNVGGISSVFKNGRNGVLIDQYDHNDVVNQINRVLSNRKLYAALGLANYSDAKEKVWSNIVAKRILKIFDDISHMV